MRKSQPALSVWSRVILVNLGWKERLLLSILRFRFVLVLCCRRVKPVRSNGTSYFGPRKRSVTAEENPKLAGSLPSPAGVTGASIRVAPKRRSSREEGANVI